MAKYAHPDVLDNGPAYIKANCNKMALISTYTLGNDYSTVNGNILAEVTGLTSGDFTITGADTADRSMALPLNKSDTSANATGGGASNHIAFLDTTGVGKVLYVVEETSGQAVSSGGQVNFPNLTYTAKQPSAS